MSANRGLSLATIAAQGGRIPGATGAIVPPLQSSTTFARDDQYRPSDGLIYGRDQNPTVAAVEEVLAQLDGGKAAFVFGSGMAASAALFQALRPGDRIAIPRVMFWSLRGWLSRFCETWGVGLDVFDANEPDSLTATVQPGRTKIVWVEPICNPTWDVIDVRAAAEVAHAAGARLAVDATAVSPALMRPLELGADIVMHSATKYLNGHSDVIAGVLVTREQDELWARIRDNRVNVGAILGAFEAWLLLRGLRTLHLRVARASSSALAIAEHFRDHPEVAEVLYPGLPSHPRHAVARSQMEGGFGGMLSLRVHGGFDAALGVARRVQVFARATSLGGVESLIEHRASLEPPDSPIPPDLLRISVGIEDVGDLIHDLEQALAASRSG